MAEYTASLLLKRAEPVPPPVEVEGVALTLTLAEAIFLRGTIGIMTQGGAFNDILYDVFTKLKVIQPDGTRYVSELLWDDDPTIRVPNVSKDRLKKVIAEVTKSIQEAYPNG